MWTDKQASLLPGQEEKWNPADGLAGVVSDLDLCLFRHVYCDKSFQNDLLLENKLNRSDTFRRQIYSNRFYYYRLNAV